MPMESISPRVQMVSGEVYDPFVIRCRVGAWPMLGDLSSAGRVVAATSPGTLCRQSELAFSSILP